MYANKVNKLHFKIKNNFLVKSLLFWNLSLQRVIIITITGCVLSIGCFWQISSICGLYFSYPTNIFIDTQFDVFDKELPAFTICTNIANRSRSKTLEKSFESFSIEKFVKEISIGFEDKMEINLTEQSFDTVLESISFRYYCFTLNSQFKGKNTFNN